MDIHTTSSFHLPLGTSLASELALLLLGRQELGQEAVRMMMAEA